MKIPGRLLTTLGGLVLIPAAASAQEALRTAVSADRALAAEPPSSVRGPDGMRWGPVQFSAGVSLSVEYDDNIRSQADDPIRDGVIRPRADLGVIWPITETSSLTAGLGVGYAFYADHSEFDYLEISPLSAVSYSVSIQDLVLTVYDQISYTGDVLDQPELTGTARYPRLDNTVGLRAAYSFADYLVQGGYAYYRYWAFDNDYDYLERGSHQFFARGAYLVAERTQVGLEGTVSLTEFAYSDRNDYDSFSFGPYVDWAILDSLTLGARGGYVIYSYKETAPVPPGQDPSSWYLDNQNSWYVGLDLRHQLTEYISHTLSAVRDVSSGINAQYVERFNLTYGIGWQMTDAWDVSLGVGYDRGTEQGQFAENYDRVGFNAGVGYQITQGLRAALAYRYFNRTSDAGNRTYDRNVVSLSAAYRF